MCCIIQIESSENIAVQFKKGVSRMRKLSSHPLYMQVFDQIKSSIRLGVYQKGQILPSEKELMEQTGVSRVTVRQALRMLAEAGIRFLHIGLIK